MKTALIVMFCVAAAMAFPQQRNEDIQIVQQTNDNPGDGNYRYGYSLSDGTNREETGEFRALGEETGILKQTGTISWTAPDGQLITLNYVADENGFRPVGDHLPK